jgi:hypothetical protein
MRRRGQARAGGAQTRSAMAEMDACRYEQNIADF